LTATNLPLNYAWSIQNTPVRGTVALPSTKAAKPTFTPDKAGDYVFALTVKDRLGPKSTTADTVKITANVGAGKRPLRSVFSAASQSAKPNAMVRITGTLRTSATGLPGQPSELWIKSGAGVV